MMIGPCPAHEALSSCLGCRLGRVPTFALCDAVSCSCVLSVPEGAADKEDLSVQYSLCESVSCVGCVLSCRVRVLLARAVPRLVRAWARAIGSAKCGLLRLCTLLSELCAACKLCCCAACPVQGCGAEPVPGDMAGGTAPPKYVSVS